MIEPQTIWFIAKVIGLAFAVVVALIVIAASILVWQWTRPLDQDEVRRLSADDPDLYAHGEASMYRHEPPRKREPEPSGA